jgi:hypothetical protein
MGSSLKLSGGVRGVPRGLALALLIGALQTTPADAKTLVLLCTGVSHCATCADVQKKTNFSWTYTIDFSANTVDGKPAQISDATITWQLRSSSVLDEREISRYSKKFHYAGKSLPDGGEFYYGDGVCSPQQQKAF